MNAIIETFVQHCGEMGSRWGFNRTVGQMAGLILASERPLSALEIASTLNISRGNVSMSIKELLTWRLIQVVHVNGDRKEYYSASGSIWDMANRVLDVRRQREIEPTLELLKSTLDANSQEHGQSYAYGKMQEIYELLDLTIQWANELQSLDSKQLRALMKMSAKAVKLIKAKDNLLNKKT